MDCNGSSRPPVSFDEVRAWVRAGVKLYACLSPCPAPVTLYEPQAYYTRLAWLCAQARDRQQARAEGRRTRSRPWSGLKATTATVLDPWTNPVSSL
jgi:hypothetical protein